MANRVILSEQFSLKWRDALRGFIMAVGTPLLYMAQEMIPGWVADPFVKAGISAGLTYIIKNFIEPAKVITTYSTNEKAIQVAENLKS